MLLVVVVGRLGAGGKEEEGEEELVVSCPLGGVGWARLGRTVAAALMRLLLGIVGRAACRRIRGAQTGANWAWDRLQGYTFWLFISSSIILDGAPCC